jgi:hypothetical protein
MTSAAVADNSAAFGKLREWIEKCATLPDAIIKKAPPAIAKELESDIKRTADAGQAPDGTAWQPTLEGKRPLKSAASDVSVRTSGTTIIASLTGNAVKHHKGTARGRIRRQVLPTRKIPDAVVRAMRKVMSKYFLEHMK